MLKYLATIAFGLVIGCSSAPTITSGDIESRLGRAGSWVEDVVRTDYTSNREGLASIKIESSGRIRKRRDLGLAEYIAAYDPTTDELFLPQPEDTERKVKTLDSIFHELWHALYDNEGEHKGLLHSPDFSGPSIDEIKAYAKARVSGKDFNSIRKGIELEKIFCQLEYSLVSVREQAELHLYLKHQEEIPSAVERSYTLFQELSFPLAIKVRIAVEYGILCKTKNMCNHAWEEFDVEKEYNALTNGLTSISSLSPEEQTKIALDIISKAESLKQQVNNLRQGKIEAYIGEERLNAKILALVSRYQIGQFESEIELLEKIALQDPNNAKAYRLRILELNELIRQCEVSFDDLPLLIETEIRDTAVRVRDINIADLEAILNHEDEVMARILDSLYNLYAGPLSQNAFMLNKEDLNFLKRFTYKGKPMFKDPVEKYGILLEMIESGINPEEARQELLESVEFKWDGRTYHWPLTELTIKGELPISK